MRRALIPLGFSLAFACGSDEKKSSTEAAPAVDCGLVVWVHPGPNVSEVEVVTSWENWAFSGHIAQPTSDGYRAVSLNPPAGDVAYGVLEDGEWTLDPNASTTTFYDGHEVALVHVPSCDAPLLRVDSMTTDASGTATIAATMLTATDGVPLDPSTIAIHARAAHGGEGDAVEPRSIDADPTKGTIAISLAGLPKGKSAFFLDAKDASGRAAGAKALSAWVEATPFDYRDMVLYQVMVDRYRCDSGPLATPSSPSARAGGTLKGVMAAIDDGTIPALSANAIWLSPLYDNPDGLWPGTDGNEYTSYHGYWPSQPRTIEPLFGTDDDLEALIADAHAHDIRILFDVVPNHTHQSHPYAQEHLATWFHDTHGTCICGTTCSWATDILDCWFAPYLPDVAWEDEDAAAQMSDDVGWWIDRWNGDGVRIDAIPMMPRAANRRIAYRLRSTYDYPGNQTFVLGENFVDEGGYALLRYELGPVGLDSEFDFPLMWALRDAIADGTGDMTEVATAIANGQAAWGDAPNAVMSLIIGNHDVTRFASESAGDASGSGWVPASTSTLPIVYEKQRLAFAAIFGLPGAPTIFYGDEVGLPGRSDPDSRRVMPADDALLPDQVATRTFVEALGKARGCSVALRRGGVRVVFSSSEHLVIARQGNGTGAGDAGTDGGNGDGPTAIVVLTRQNDGPLRTPLPGIAAGKYVDLLGGDPIEANADLTTIPSEAFSAHIYVPEGDACATP